LAYYLLQMIWQIKFFKVYLWSNKFITLTN
jgi:hypothetical protein